MCLIMFRILISIIDKNNPLFCEFYSGNAWPMDVTGIEELAG